MRRRLPDLRRLELALAQRAADSHGRLAIIDRALTDTDDQQPWLRVSLLSAAVRTLVRADGSSSSAVQEVLSRARPLAHGRHRVFNAATSAFAHDRRADGRVERVLGVIEQMRREGVRPSSFTLQHVFIAARGERSGSEELLQMLAAQMSRGLRPSRAAFDCLLDACTQRTPAPSGAPVPSRLPLLLQVMQLCDITPSGSTVRALLLRVQSPADLAAVEPLLATLPPVQLRSMEVDGSLLAARARANPDQVIEGAIGALRRRSAGLPTSHGYRPLLLECAARGDHERCLALLEAMWGSGRRADERVARHLMHRAGEGAHLRQPGAHALLTALSAAMFDGHHAVSALHASAQRGDLRRGGAAEHEAVRTLARAEWLAGFGRAAEVQSRALRRLRAADVAPLPKLFATCVYMHAAQGDFVTAVQMLEASAAKDASAAADGFGAAAAAVHLTETPHLALLAAVRRPAEVEHAVGALRLMVTSGVRPTLRTRIALARMADRVQQARGAANVREGLAGVPSPPVPGSARFWEPQVLPVDRWLEALRVEARQHSSTGAREEEGGSGGDGGRGSSGSSVDGSDGDGSKRADGGSGDGDDAAIDRAIDRAAGELILEARMATYLARIEEIMEGGTGLVVDKLRRIEPLAKGPRGDGTDTIGDAGELPEPSAKAPDA